jgi:phospholipid/cholesterol/gamma-HCH transport system ATP-binding protein
MGKSGPNDDVVISVQSVHKSFGDKHVHRGVSFDLRRGEILALFGGSGTGKSVVLRSIIGLERPDKGRIMYKDQDLCAFSERELYPVRTEISYVFQNGALFDSLTVEQNLAYPLDEHTDLTEDQIHKRVNEALAAIDMKGSNHLLPAELSGGMQKRVGLARATIIKPEVVLYDEPTAGLDPTNTQRVLDNIKTLKSKGDHSGIFVTHDIPSAFEIADRIAILSEGKVPVLDTVKNIKKSTDPLVRSFIAGAV